MSETNPTQITNPTQPNNAVIGGNTAQQEKTFTQAELDRIVGERLSRVKNETLSDDEVKAFRSWKQNQKTEAEKLKEREDDYKAAARQIQELKAEKSVIKAQAKPEFAEFIASKVLAMVDDKTTIDQAVEAYKKDNPQYFGETVVRRVDSAPKLSNGDKTGETTTNSIMNNLIRGK